jgi:hypothetical protein
MGTVGAKRQATAKKDLPVAWIEGMISFRNPYGFIPAELYGVLPFEGAKMAAYLLLSVFFLVSYFSHKESILPLHNTFLVVLLFAFAEAVMWYATYQAINISGEPYCCPFPPIVVGSLVLQIFRQTLSRTLLLVVSLGYGIVRPKLMSAEWVAIAIVSALYFATGKNFFFPLGFYLFLIISHGCTNIGHLDC